MSFLPRRVVPQEKNRRGWCPSLARPMPTGDGFLARVHPPLGILGVAQVRALAEGARLFGNGHVDVTARGNLQVRGVRVETAASLAGLLAQAGLGDPRDDGGPQRLTLTSPLAGLGPGETVDVPALARAIEGEGRGIPGLPAKTLVAILGAGVSGEGADIVVRPAADGRVFVSLAGDADAMLAVAASEAAGAVAAMLRAFTATGGRRIRDLPVGERAAVIRAGEEAARSPPPLPSAGGGFSRPALAVVLPIGLGEVGAVRTIAVEAPFGRCTADALDRLADAARDIAARDTRTTPARGFVLACDRRDAAEAALDTLAAAGFVTQPHDPRRAVAACPGAPACASGTTPVPEHAERIAKTFAPFAARGLQAHVSGCAKGCAHPAAADLTLVAEHGRYAIVLHGAPHDEPATRLTFEAALDRVRRADPAAPLADAFRTEFSR